MLDITAQYFPVSKLIIENKKCHCVPFFYLIGCAQFTIRKIVKIKIKDFERICPI
jgi:hypothetical protein